MYQPLYISSYNDARSRRAKEATHLAHELVWAAHLPVDWRDQVLSPLWVQVHRDRDCGSERWVGYNEDDQPCWVRHRFVIEGRHFSAEPGERAVGYCEDLVAWWMRDGRWLIHRTILSQSHKRPTSYSFYALSERMPR